MIMHFVSIKINKAIWRLLVAVIINSNCCPEAEAQPKPGVTKPGAKTMANKYKMQDEFGLKIFKALQQKDTSAWIELYPTQQEYESLLRLMLEAKTDGLTPQMVEQMLLQRKKEAAATYSKEFLHFLEQADSLNIDWSKAVFGKFEFIAAPTEKINIKYLTGDIWFTSANHQFMIADIEALEFAGGYKLQAVKEIKKSDQ